jgi:mRNA interferase HigB
VHVISQKALRDFASRHREAGSSLAAWFKLAKNGKYRNFAELKRTFSSVDLVPVKDRDFYVFNIKGNSYRLVASIHFGTQKLFIRRIMTHAEYDRGDWKKNP